MHPRDKARLYHDLGEMIRSGVTLQRAVERLSNHSRGPAGRVLRGIGAGIARGDTLADTLPHQPGINELDAALFAASERSGKLDRGFALAEGYYAALAEARSRVLSRIAYPLFLAHFAVVAMSAPVFVTNGANAGLRSIFTGLAVLWGVIVAGWAVITAIRHQAERSIAVDRSLGFIPIIGGMRRDLALSRFSAAYDMQLEAGVNVFGALEASGRASASASYRAAATRALADVRSGETVCSALTATRAFPERFLRAFMVGEESGRLDQELRALSEEYRVGGLRKLEALSEWIPRLVMITVFLLIAWKVVSAYFGYLKGIQDIVGS
jgi:type IV pilus assembly protein PilC